MGNGTCKLFLLVLSELARLTFFCRADKKLVAAMTINHWLIYTFDTRRFREPAAGEMVRNLIRGFESTGKVLFLVGLWIGLTSTWDLGIVMNDKQPMIRSGNPQGNIVDVSIALGVGRGRVD